MTCHEFWSRMPELEAGGQALEHVRECPGCAALLERQRSLAVGLGRAASQRHELEAPDYLEQRLVEAFRANLAAPQQAPPAPHMWASWPAQLAAAAAVMVLAVVLLWQRPAQRAQPAPGPETAAAAELDADFTPLPYAGEAGSTEDADVIRVEMPRSALIALGVPVGDDETGEPVEAEVLLGMGGAPQAVRILQ
jgi:hypothetical protein